MGQVRFHYCPKICPGSMNLRRPLHPSIYMPTFFFCTLQLHPHAMTLKAHLPIPLFFLFKFSSFARDVNESNRVGSRAETQSSSSVRAKSNWLFSSINRIEQKLSKEPSPNQAACFFSDKITNLTF